MEALTALSVAGNVLQFVQFLAELVNDTRQIYSTAAGATSQNQNIEDIYGKLIDFNARLQSVPLSQDLGPGTLKHCEALAASAASCKGDCEKLIAMVEKLKVKDGKAPRQWRSFQAALAGVWGSSDIKQLKKRIDDRQRAMILQLCSISSENVTAIILQLQELRHQNEGWNSTESGRLSGLSKTLDDIRHRIDRLRPQTEVAPDDIETLSTGISKLSIAARDYIQEQRILSSLDYDERPLRHSIIPEAHRKTFAWSLTEPTESTKKRSSLLSWLLGRAGLFWVSGKPGSGKSTFMKFIADNPITNESLTEWASPRKLIIASHYFSIYGTPIQRSQEGLLRSLLYDILRQSPKLIPKHFPKRWEATRSEQLPWSQSELEATLRRVAAETELPVSFCFFIDGLDEFKGDHIEICQTLIELSQSPYIKLCISSRPWNIFEDTLGNVPDSKLYIHELTYNDIRNYTECRLREHPRWVILGEEANFKDSASSLIDDVTAKANGVFLWVFLVTRLLREGITNDDSISDLQRRLSTFPADLEPFFKHILESVDPFYHEKMAGTLLLALHAEKPLQLEMYMFHDFEYEDEDYAFKEPSELLPSTLEEIFKILDSVSRRLNGRCKGLLERNGDRMEFLHRTVWDFLSTAEMYESLKKMSKGNFSPSLSLLRASIAWIKRAQFKDGPGKADINTMGGLAQRLKTGLEYARVSEGLGKSSAALTAALLDNLDQSIQGMFSRGQIPGTGYLPARCLYRKLVLEANIKGYIQSKEDIYSQYFTADNDRHSKRPQRHSNHHSKRVKKVNT